MSWGSEPRLALVSFPHLALVLAWRAHPELLGEAVLVSHRGRAGRPEVLAASPPAMATGAHPGQEWGQAELCCPRAVRLRADLGALDRLRQEVMMALYACTPLLEWNDDTSAYLDLGGSNPGCPGEPARASQLGRAVQQVLGMPPALGVGQSRFVAWAAARAAGPGRARLVPDGKAAEFLADWPVGELPLPERTREQLLGFGLYHCGDCAAIPLADLQRQLGPDGIQLHRLCIGRDGAAIRPWREAPSCRVRKELAGAVESTEALRFGAPQLASQLASQLALQGMAARRLRLLLEGEQPAREGGGILWDEISPPFPVAAAEELQAPTLSLLSRARCRVLAIELQALDLAPAAATQALLWPGSMARREEIDQAVARLHERFGEKLVWKVSLRPGHPGDIPAERLSWNTGDRS